MYIRATATQRNKAYIITICLVFVLAMITTHNFCKPTIRESNTNLRNLVGPTGEQRLPHAIIIGVRKAGTRAMLSYLMRHPDIAAARAEVHYFSQWRNLRQGLDWYRGLMPYSRPDQITIEKTPAYFHTEGVPELVHAMNRSVRLILVVRSPVDRAISDYLQYMKNRWWFRMFGYSFEDIADPNNRFFYIVQRSAYIQILERWLQFFPKEQILVINGNKLAHDPTEEMKIAQDFLGVKQYLDNSFFVYNEERGFYCIKNKDMKKNDEHCLGENKGRPHPEVSEEVRQKLKEHFKPYNERLFKLIGRRFDWND